MYLEPESYLPISALQIQGQCSIQLHWHNFLTYEKKIPSMKKKTDGEIPMFLRLLVPQHTNYTLLLIFLLIQID